MTIRLGAAGQGDTSIDAVYSAYTYQAAFGIVGSVIAAFMVKSSRGGRKFAMAFWTILSGIFLFGLTAAKTPLQINVLTCAAAMAENVSLPLFLMMVKKDYR